MTPESAVESATLGWFGVVLGSPLADAISRINPDLPASAVDDVVRMVIHGQPCIDKSVFRRKVGRRERIAPAQPTVDFIRAHLDVAVVVLPLARIARLERELIATFAAQWDLYNLSGNPRPSRRQSREGVSLLSRAERSDTVRRESVEERKSIFAPTCW